MPRVPRGRLLDENTSFHEIWRAHNNEYLLAKPGAKESYLNALYFDYTKKRNRNDFVIHAYSIMDSHAHLERRIRKSLKAFSNHIRRAYGIFGQRYNRQHGRAGKVARERPKTIVLEDWAAEMRCQFYIDANRMRAGQAKHPTDYKWRTTSSCRFYAYGEKNGYEDMLTPPEWYLALGRTPRLRQRAYRKLLDAYLRESTKEDPRMGKGFFYGRALWIKVMRAKLRKALDADKDSRAPP